MNSSELQDIEKSFNGVKKACGIVKTLFLVILVVFVVIWLLFVAFVTFGVFSQGANQSAWGLLAYLVVFGALIVALLYIALRFFTDVAKGESPFSIKQTKRMRIAALLFLVVAIVDTIASSGLYYEVSTLDFGAGFLNAQQSDDPILKISLGPVFASIFLYCFSIAFEYGVRLQNLSDDTL